MLSRFIALPITAFAALILSPSIAVQAQTAPAKKSDQAHEQSSGPVDPDDLEVHVDGWSRPIPRVVESQKPAPAPKHDISGTWEPAEGWRNGVQAQGAYNYPMDGKHPLPYTPEGEKAWREHKYGDGFGSYPLAEVNDPFKMCDPIGFPRIDLHDLRGIQIVQTPKKVLVVYENDQVWRSIWTDGRDFPKITEPRWYGYSTGKWVDDYTFVVETTGLDERTWIDNAGRPHTKDLRVEEQFHRVNHDLMQLTLTIIDPQYYTQPWNALDKYPLRLQSDSFDIREMVCSESEAEIYNKEIAEEAAAAQNVKKQNEKNQDQKNK
jgi:hypothetical protein